MKKRNILMVILILLVMICVVGYIFTLENNNSETNNTSYNNSTNLKLNKSDKNISLNNTALSKDEDNVKENLNNKYYNPSSNNNGNKKDSNDTNDSYDEAMAAKKAVERNVLDKNEIAGYPVYKHPRLDSWLVPIFDKKTNKFISSVYVHVGSEGNYYVSGPQFYQQYKDIISGNSIPKSKSKITADDILKIVKNDVWWDDGKGKSTQDVKLGKPYKEKSGFWLVGAFDKKTGKFLGAVWVGPDGGGFTHGPDSYSEYKEIISGKSIQESKSNKNDRVGKSAPVEEKIPDFSERYVLATPNPNGLNAQDILISDQLVLNDEEAFLGSDQLMSVMESDCELNSTS